MSGDFDKPCPNNAAIYSSGSPDVLKNQKGWSPLRVCQPVQSVSAAASDLLSACRDLIGLSHLPEKFVRLLWNEVLGQIKMCIPLFQPLHRCDYHGVTGAFKTDKLLLLISCWEYVIKGQIAARSHDSFVLGNCTCRDFVWKMYNGKQALSIYTHLISKGLLFLHSALHVVPLISSSERDERLSLSPYQLLFWI